MSSCEWTFLTSQKYVIVAFIAVLRIDHSREQKRLKNLEKEHNKTESGSLVEMKQDAPDKKFADDGDRINDPLHTRSTLQVFQSNIKVMCLNAVLKY